MKKLLTIALILSSQFCLSMEVEFVGGNDMSVTYYKGSTWASSDRPHRTKYYICDETVFEGDKYARLAIFGEQVDADTIKLQRVGNRYVQVRNFNSLVGESTKKFNLWDARIFSAQLLKVGKNKINYTFLKNKQIVKAGQFVVNIKVSHFIECEHGFVRLQNFSNSQFMACTKYFSYKNLYCSN
ncbi:MAG: hypothetical protein HON90_01075 [Halobacteriovoraceae bacterium]|jgi:hypothetical protein|nr:hypothetical protein [Halobacteriovoraceae bacterium]